MIVKLKIFFTITNFDQKIIEYLSKIPLDIIYSVLPFIRWHDSKGNYRTLTISKSIKINKNTSKKLLANKLEQDLNEILKTYELANKTMDFYLMSRPWLKRDDFNIDEAGLTNLFNEQLERELSTWSNQKDQDKFSQKRFEKANSLKDYSYKNIFINNYGEPLFDKNNNLIGYKINETESASIETYFNNENLLCNKVSIKEFDTIKQSFINEYDDIASWIDIKTDSGFIREYKKNKYYYDKNNNLINVEVNFNYSSFPTYKKDVKLNDKTGTIDFETYGSNSGPDILKYMRVVEQ